MVFSALVSDGQSSAERKVTGAASGAALAMWFSCLPTASSCFYYYYYIFWPLCVYSHDSRSFFSFLIIITISSMSTAKQTLVLEDLFCHVMITICHRLDDHDFISSGAQSQACCCCKARSPRSRHRSQLTWLGSLLVMTKFDCP